MSLDEFKKRYAQWGGRVEFPNVKRCIRVNTACFDEQDVIARLEERRFRFTKVPYLNEGYWIEKSPFNIVSTPEYLLGKFFIQDAASQVPASLLEAEGQIVLDACAAPGGKTCQLAASAKGVVAVDRNLQRFRKLELNLYRLGLGNVIGYTMDILDWKEPGFSRILLDAPCSGNYMLERHWFKKASMKRILERQRVQKELSTHGIKLLEKKGIMVYCTCSLEPEEDEMVVQSLLDAGVAELVPIDCDVGAAGLTEACGQSFDDSMIHCQRFWPHQSKTIGFFIAKMRRI